MENQLILGDNLQILKSLPDESVDLIYIDPPFFSNRNYEVIWGDDGEIRSFQDRWQGGMEHYIGWLKERVEEMHRVLKPTGSMYLHCDWHADAYIRVHIMDKVFGMGNFRNEIVWKRAISKNNTTKKFGVLSDTIFYYTKSNIYKYNQIYTEYSKEQMSRYKNEDDNGLYRCENLTSPGRARQFEWRGVHPGENRSWCYNLEKLEELYSNDLIVLQKDGRPRKDGLKKYLKDTNGDSLSDLWDDIALGSTSKERIGYPTQKPEALLERIIKASSNEGDVVLDAFCGGGTTLAVADRLKRKWIGVDQSVQAIKVSEARINNQQIRLGMASRLDKKGDQGSLVFDAKPFSVKLHKYDYDIIRYSDAFEFENWIVKQFGGEANVKQRGDMGLDGKKNGIPIQVKRSEGIGRNVVDNFKSAIGRFYGKAFDQKKNDNEVDGFIIAFSFGKGAYEEIARLKNEEGLLIELVKVENIIPIAKKPKLAISFEDKGLNDKGQRVIEFTSKAESDAELYQWDFGYSEDEGFNAEVMIDKTGVQTYEFAAGEYNIACKVVDVEGLESVESIKLKINGVVKQV
jgi:DNA modification methylase